MVSKESRRKKFKIAQWVKSDGQGGFPTPLDAQAMTRDGRHSATKQVSPQQQQMKGQKASKKIMVTNTTTSRFVPESPTMSSKAELFHEGDRIDGESLSEILDGPYLREAKEAETHSNHDKKNSKGELTVENLTDNPLKLKPTREERDSHSWMSGDLENEERAIISEYPREGDLADVHDNHDSLKIRFRRFLDSQRASMLMRRRDAAVGTHSNLLQLYKNASSELLRHGDAAVVIHCETRDAQLKADRSISEARRRSKFRGWRNPIKKNIRTVNARPPLKQLKSGIGSDIQSLSSDEVSFFSWRRLPILEAYRSHQTYTCMFRMKEGDIEFESSDDADEDFLFDNDDDYSDASSWLSEDMYSNLDIFSPFIDNCALWKINN